MRAAAMILSALAAVPAALADEAPYEWFARLPGETIRILPGELFDRAHAAQVLPLLGYADREEWLALTCREHCTLVPVELRTQPATVTPAGSDTALSGQTLALERKPEGVLIAVLRGLPGKFRRRPDTRLHGGMASYPRPGSRGTLEIGISGGRGDRARIVPRLPRDATYETPLSYYLEADGKRQLLGSVSESEIAGYDALAKGTQLLRWAGDLDGDGRLDLVMSFRSRSGEQQAATLYLSSAATADELVHAVANFDYFPVDNPGC